MQLFTRLNAFDRRLLCLLTALLAAITLAGCGGGGGGGSSATPPPPASGTNQAPTISGAAPATADEDELYNFTPTASDADGDSLSFSISNPPAWASFNTATGELRGTPTRADVGTYDNIVITVSDGPASAVLAPFSIQIVQVTNLVIGGVVTDEPIANAEIIVRIGEDEFTTTADAFGVYEILLKLRVGDYDPDALVEVYATGVGTQQQVELIAIVGGVAALIEAAGDDEVLTSDENNRLNVTHVSTARHLLSIDANGGTAPADLESLDAAETGTDSAAMIEVAALIKLIVDDGLIEVPEGQTVIDLLQDATGVKTVLSTIEALLTANGLLDADGEPTPPYQEAIDNAIAETLADPATTMPFTAEMLSGVTVWTQAVVADWVPFGAEVIEFGDDGGGVAYDPHMHRGFAKSALEANLMSDAFTWSIDSGVLDIQFTNNVESTFPAACCEIYTELVEDYGFDQAVADFVQQNVGQLPSGQIEIETKIIGRQVAVLSEIGDWLQVSVAESLEHNLDSTLQLLGWQGELPVSQVTEDYSRQVLLDPYAQDPGVDMPVVGDTWAVPVFYSLNDTLLPGPEPDPVHFQQDVFTMLGGGTTSSGEFGSAAMQWTTSEMSFTLESGGESFTYTPISTNGDVIFALITNRLNGIVQFHATTWIVAGDGTGSTFAADLVQEMPVFWQAGLNQQSASHYLPDGRLDPDYLFGRNFMNEINMHRLFLEDYEGNNCFNNTSSACFVRETVDYVWSTVDGILIELTRMPGETLPRHREWRVLRYAPGGRAVMLEVDYVQFPDEPWSVLIRPRINTQELSDLSDWPEWYDEARFSNSPPAGP